MPRNRKSEEDAQLNHFIGSKVHLFRLEQGWSLEQLAPKLEISGSHLKALESGRYSFSAGLLTRLAMAFQKPLAAFLPAEFGPVREEVKTTWERLFDALTVRDRNAVLELARMLAGGGQESLLKCWKQLSTQAGCLVSLEGIDGVLLDRISDRLLELMGNDTSPPAASRYDFDSELWQFMVRRFREMTVAPFNAFERSLLYACERLHRQEREVRRLLAEGRTVITHFFSLAPQVYQQIERLMDTSAIQAIGGFLLEPELIVVVDSDPGKASGRATRGIPGPEQFYSPYRGVESFTAARKLHATAAREAEKRGIPVMFISEGTSVNQMAADIHARITAVKLGIQRP